MLVFHAQMVPPVLFHVLYCSVLCQLALVLWTSVVYVLPTMVDSMAMGCSIDICYLWTPVWLLQLKQGYILKCDVLRQFW